MTGTVLDRWGSKRLVYDCGFKVEYRTVTSPRHPTGWAKESASNIARWIEYKLGKDCQVEEVVDMWSKDGHEFRVVVDYYSPPSKYYRLESFSRSSGVWEQLDRAENRLAERLDELRYHR